MMDDVSVTAAPFFGKAKYKGQGKWSMIIRYNGDIIHESDCEEVYTEFMMVDIIDKKISELRKKKTLGQD